MYLQIFLNNHQLLMHILIKPIHPLIIFLNFLEGLQMIHNEAKKVALLNKIFYAFPSFLGILCHSTSRTSTSNPSPPLGSIRAQTLSFPKFSS